MAREHVNTDSMGRYASRGKSLGACSFLSVWPAVVDGTDGWLRNSLEEVKSSWPTDTIKTLELTRSSLSYCLIGIKCLFDLGGIVRGRGVWVISLSRGGGVALTFPRWENNVPTPSRQLSDLLPASQEPPLH